MGSNDSRYEKMIDFTDPNVFMPLVILMIPILAVIWAIIIAIIERREEKQNG